MTKSKGNGKAKAVQAGGRAAAPRKRAGSPAAGDGAGHRKRDRPAAATGTAKAGKGRKAVGGTVAKPKAGKASAGAGGKPGNGRKPAGRPAGAKRSRAAAIEDAKRAQADVLKGRPTKLTPERLDAVLAGLRAGKFLTIVCEELRKADPDFPHPDTIGRWAALDSDLSSALAHARATGAERMLAAIPDIADDGLNDWMEMRGGYVTNREAIGRSRLRVDARLKLAAIMSPTTAGAKLELADNPERPLGGPKKSVTDYTEAELVAAFEEARKAREER